MLRFSAILLLFALFLPDSSQAQWSWPERSENLQVLPADFAGNRVRAVMTGFTRALGVRCSHCHVGEEGQPLSTYDFASDDNPKKRIARSMLELLGDVNQKLNSIDDLTEDRVNMWCHTCHRGAARPQTLEEALLETYRTSGVDAMLDQYHALRERYYGRGTYDFGEGSLNGLGYTLVGEEDLDGAVQVFRLNVEQFPESANPYDSLAEAYLAQGETELAVVYYSKSLELDPTNRNALNQLRAIRGE